MTIKVTMLYQFKDKEEYKKFFESHIDPLWNSNEDLPVKITAISQSDMFKVIDDIEEFIHEDGYDSYGMTDYIQEVIDNQFSNLAETYTLDDTEKVFDKMVSENQKDGLYSV